MLDIAADYPEYAQWARRTTLTDTSSGSFYGAGYQDVQTRRPKIDDTIEALGWAPQVGMEASLRRIFEYYRGKVVEARALLDVAS